MASSLPEPGTTGRFHPDPALSYTLPGTYYRDRGIFEREKEEIWFKTWQYVGNLQDLREPGDYITFTLIDQPVFVVRAKDGRLRAYYNVCMHRGHILLEGKGNTRMITCPFHAWTYDLEGNLKAAGNSENVAGFEHEDFCLPEIGVAELGPMVFVNFDPDATPLADIAAGLLDELRTVIPDFDALTCVRRESFDIKANWKFILDGLECYHCPTLHPQLMGSENGYVETSWESIEHEYWTTHIIRGNYEMMERNKEKLPYDFGEGGLRDVYIWFLWPNLIFVAHQGPSNFKILHALADDADHSTRHIVNFCLNDPPTAYDVGQMNNYSNVVWPQDISAIERQQQGVRSRGYTQGRLMVDAERSWQSEHGTHHFDNLVWMALNGANYEDSAGTPRSGSHRPEIDLD